MISANELNTNAVGFDKSIALVMAQLSNLAYESEILIVQSLAGSGYKTGESFFFEDDETHSQGFVISNDHHLVVSFRGTEEHLNDWISNVRIGLLPWGSDQGGALVHAGFKTALDSIWEQLLDLINRHRTNNQSIWITGHSLGGALALIAAARLSAHNPELNIAAVYTFAQPKVGNKAFIQQLQPSLSSRIYRVVNEGDMVPGLPPCRLGYKHVGHLEEITESGDIVEDYQHCWLTRLWHRLKEYAPLVRLLESAMTDMEEHRLDSYIAVLKR